jgi:hypothetical protein
MKFKPASLQGGEFFSWFWQQIESEWVVCLKSYLLAVTSCIQVLAVQVRRADYLRYSLVNVQHIRLSKLSYAHHTLPHREME